MDWLTTLYPEVRNVLENSIPDYWTTLEPIFQGLFDQPPPLLSVAILPLACCRAVDGRPEDAVAVSAALIAAEVALRIFDDSADKDRPGQLWEAVGEARALNIASAIHVLSFEILNAAPLPPPVFRKVNQLFIDAFFHITAGQELDLIGMPETIEELWRIMELKTGAAYSASCQAGALVGTENRKHIDACHTYGHHVGLAVQIFNDMESIWQTNGISDLKKGKITLPLMHGLLCNDVGHVELHALVTANDMTNHTDRIKQILENMGTKDFLVWAALKQRDEALAALDDLPDTEGRDALEAYITGMFGELSALIA